MYRRVYIIIYRELFMPATRCFATRATAATIDVGRIILYRYTYPAVSGIYLYGFMGSRRPVISFAVNWIHVYVFPPPPPCDNDDDGYNSKTNCDEIFFFPPPPPEREPASRTARRSILCVYVPLTARWQWHHAHVAVW